MASERYFIGPGLKDKLREVIYRVDEMPRTQSGVNVPTVEQSLHRNPPPVRLAAYPKTIKWEAGQTQEVSIYDSKTLQPLGVGAVVARNVCNTFDEGADGGPTSTMTWCIVSRSVGGETLAVEGPQKQKPPVAIRVGKVASSWPVGTCATVMLWERIGTNCALTATSPTETIEGVANLSHDVSAGSWVVIGQAADGKWYLLEAARDEGSGGGGIRVGKVDGDWSVGTCAAVTLWERIGTNCEPAAKSPTETIEGVANLSHDVPSGSWVVIGQAADGKWYLLEAVRGGGTRVGKVADAWLIGTCATVSIWERDGTDCSLTENGSAETVENVANLSHNVRAGSWVVISQASDGQWYLVESGTEGSCGQTIGGEDITQWNGWDGTKQQLLGHDENGCLKWFDVTECPTGG